MMDHKAYLFDFTQFEAELLPILEETLNTSECDRLISFLRQNISSLSDPYEGEPLEEDWETMVDPKDAHQYGDFAITKYYRPNADIGLGRSWEAVQDLVRADRTTSPILGRIVGPDDSPFDPGKMGSYFQSPRDAEVNIVELRQLGKRRRSLIEVDQAIDLLQCAVNAKLGLYVTF